MFDRRVRAVRRDHQRIIGSGVSDRLGLSVLVAMASMDSSPPSVVALGQFRRRGRNGRRLVGCRADSRTKNPTCAAPPPHRFAIVAGGDRAANNHKHTAASGWTLRHGSRSGPNDPKAPEDAACRNFSFAQRSMLGGYPTFTLGSRSWSIFPQQALPLQRRPKFPGNWMAEPR
jgi:hypothetical protein